MLWDFLSTNSSGEYVALTPLRFSSSGHSSDQGTTHTVPRNTHPLTKVMSMMIKNLMGVVTTPTEALHVLPDWSVLFHCGVQVVPLIKLLCVLHVRVVIL